ncbi:protein of unknown function DUF2235 [Penicillium occitanis (nom. inval.)]|nr:hypothetical protein PENOC_020290 [Penicillium occitanis (nom. inval.)]PCH09549.1 protein of unknown function DUF2235 [Penicillium occitanis (nom. inval.)]
MSHFLEMWRAYRENTDWKSFTKTAWTRLELCIPINKQYAFHNTNLAKNVEYAFQALAIDERRLTFPPTLCASDYEEIGDITVAWMVDNLSGMLTFEEMAINKLIKEHHDALVENNARNNVINDWGVGPLFPTSPGCKVPSSGFLGSKIAHQAAIREMQATEIVAPRMSISIRSPASGSPSSPTITQHR